MPEALRILGQLVMLVALIGVVGVMALVQCPSWFRGQSYDPMVIAACRSRYTSARSAVESLAVDQVAPMQTRKQAAMPVTCSELRRLGRI